MSSTAKVYKVTVLVVDANGEYSGGADQVREEIDHRLYRSFAQVKDVETADVGEWSDDHPLNQRGADWKKYFEN